MRLKRNIKILKSNKNQIQETNKSFQNPKERVIYLLKRISESYPSEIKKLNKLNQYIKKSYIFQIKNKDDKLDFSLNYITKDMNIREQIFLHKVNLFKKRMEKYEKSQTKNFNLSIEHKKDNDYFLRKFNNFMKKKNLTEKIHPEKIYYFNILNKYLLNKIRLPKLTTNVFSLNPLIINPGDLKNFFEYNKVDVDKYVNYMERIKEIVSRKILGKEALSEEEKVYLNLAIKNEKPKGYIPPGILIQNLQEDIAKIQKLSDYLKNETKSETLEKTKINPQLLSKVDINNNNDNQKIISNPYNIDDNKVSEEIDNENNNNDKEQENKENIIYKNENQENRSNIIINNNSMDTTIPFDSKIISLKTPKMNIFNNKFNKNFFITPHTNNLRRNAFKKNYFFRNNELGNSILSLSKNLKKNKDSNDSFLLINNKNDKNEIDKGILTPKEPKEEDINIINKSNLDDENNQDKETAKDKEDEKDLENPIKINEKSNFNFFKKSIPKIIEKKDKPSMQNSEQHSLDELYNKALHLKSNSFDDKTLLENYLISNTMKKDLNQIINLRNAYYNIARMEKNFEKNLLKKIYSYRKSNRNSSYELDNKQKQMLERNTKYTNTFLRNANKFRKILCEKYKDFNID